MNELAIIRSVPPEIKAAEHQSLQDLNPENIPSSKIDTQVDSSEYNSHLSVELAATLEKQQAIALEM